jgi:hypothetical protein
MRVRKNAINLSASAISRSTRIRRRKSKCGTALSHCETLGRRKRRDKGSASMLLASSGSCRMACKHSSNSQSVDHRRNTREDWLATCHPERAECSRSPSERRQGSVDARKNFLFPEYFQQVIQARTYIATSRRESCGVNNCAEFYAELCRSSF